MGTVLPGQTLAAHGTLAAGSDLTVDGGAGATQGGTLKILGAAGNEGFVLIQSSSTTSESGALVTIGVHGVLTNQSDIIVGLGGFPSIGNGPSIEVNGTFDNDALFRFGEGYAGGPPTLNIGSTGVLSNAGTFYLTGGRPGDYAPEVGATVTDTGVLTNSGTLEFFGGNTGANYGGTGAQLDVTGTLTNTGLVNMEGCYGGLRGDYQPGTSGTLAVTGKLVNESTILVDAANTYGYGFGVTGSTLSILKDGNLYNHGSIDILGGARGTTGAPPGGQLNVGYLGFGFNYGNITVGGGAPSLFASNGGNGGTLTLGSGSIFDNYGTLTAAGGVSGGLGGVISVAASGNLTVGQGLGTPGTIDLQTGAANSGGGVLVDRGFVFVSSRGAIDINGGAQSTEASVTIASGGMLFDEGVILGSGLLLNDGTINPDGNITITAGVLVNNATVLSPDFTTFTINASVGTSIGDNGLFDLISGGKLTFENSVAAGQSVLFDNRYNAGMTLALGDAAAFAGTLDALGPDATIDFLKLDVTGASSSGDVLKVDLSGGGSINLALNAPLPAGTGFSLTSDNAGGTDLRLIAPGVPAHDHKLSAPLSDHGGIVPPHVA